MTETPTARDLQAELRHQLVRGLTGKDAHMTFEEAVAEFPEWAMNERAPKVDYTPWHLIEHLRITQWDILEYVRNPSHVSPEWPRQYWPKRDAVATPAEFQATIDGFLRDREALAGLLRDRSVDLLAPMTHAPQHTVAREARVVANHNSYHVGELGALRQVMGCWGPSH